MSSIRPRHMFAATALPREPEAPRRSQQNTRPTRPDDADGRPAPSPQHTGAITGGRGRPSWIRRLLGPGLVRHLPAWLQDQLVLRRLPFDPTVLDDVVVKIASTPEEHDAAARLTFEAYQGRGLVQQRGVPVRVTPFLLLPSTVKLVALRGGEVVATVSLMLDSQLGLPMQSLFFDELAALRRKGRRLAEVGALAIRKEHRGSGLVMMVYKALWHTAALLGVQNLVVAVHPNSQPEYTSPLRFVPLCSGVRRYPGLEASALAVGLSHDVEQFPRVAKRDFEHLGPSLFNTWRFFFETQHRQIQLPSTPEALAPLRAAHREAALRLAALRPEILLEMKDKDFALLVSSI